MIEIITGYYRNNKFHILWIPIVLVFLVSPMGCGPGMSDFHVKLIGNYSLWVCNSEEIRISPPSINEETPFIPPTVRFLNFDGNYIFAQNTSPGSNKTGYWILDALEPSVFGPLSYKEYRSKLSKFGIKTEPILINVWEFRTR